MRKNLFLICCCMASVITVYSQEFTLKGTVADSTDNKNLKNTLVSLLSPKDSTLMAFTRADQAGKFDFPKVDSGSYIMMITHPYLGDFFDRISIGPDKTKDVGKIFLIPKSKLLAEVIIKSGSPIRIKGDTTVYTADSFKVKEGANVEELLRRLPGIQVDKDGNITAMGERVKKVLVDGEEFFGTDPGVATKNLRADGVKEVEVFDKKSEQSDFTGIDDGVKDKTINLKMKDDKKKGYFGKIEAGGGNPDRFTGSVMLNAFKAKRKIAGYAFSSNMGKTNLGWEDNQNYGGSAGVESGVSEDGGMYMMMNGDEDYYDGQNGIPTNWNGGLHYSNKYNNNKQTVNGGYRFSKINTPIITRINSRTFLPDTSWSTNSTREAFSSKIKHAVNFRVETTLDSSNTIKWITKLNNGNNRNRSKFYSETLSDQLDTINNSRRENVSESDKNGLNSTLLWQHKFKKKARTLSVNSEVNWNQSKNNDFLNAVNSYFNSGNLLRRDTLDQQTIQDNETSSFNTKFSYTEPLLKDMYMELSYALGIYGNKNNQQTLQNSGGGKYDDRIDSLSNDFIFNRLSNTPGLNFRVNKKKYSYSFGSAVGFSQFVQKNLTEGTRTNYNFTNFFPRGSFNYKLKPNENIRIQYNGNTTAPSLTQLQPIRVNTDPLNIYIGNPDLDQSFRHNLSLNYGSWNMLKERNIWMDLSYSLTENAFSQISRIDNVGKTTTQTVNVNGVQELNFYADYGQKINKTKFRIGFGPNITYARNIDFVTDSKTSEAVRNITTSSRFAFGPNINYYDPKKLNFRIRPEFAYNKSHATVNSAANTEYWEVQLNTHAAVTIFWKMEISTDLNLQARQKDPRFPANSNFAIWNSSIEKSFLKNELEFKFTVYDMLNQNRGYTRSFYGYNFSETYTNTLKRFAALSVIWNFTRNGKPVRFNFD